MVSAHDRIDPWSIHVYKRKETKTKELTAAYTKSVYIQKKTEEEERIRNEKEKQIALEMQIEDRIGAQMTQWEQLKREKEDVQDTERAVEAKCTAYLELTICKKEEEETKCCIM